MNKAKELLNDKNSVLVFDIDGVLALMEWGDHTHFGETDEEWAASYDNADTLYTEECVIKKMQNYLKDKDMSRIYSITRVWNEKELEDKKNYAFNNYGIPKDHVFGVYSNKEKLDVLHQIKSEYPELKDEQLVMIDDTADVLTIIMENSDFSTVHVSTLMDL
jgi:hypothetical protein